MNDKNKYIELLDRYHQLEKYELGTEDAAIYDDDGRKGILIGKDLEDGRFIVRWDNGATYRFDIEFAGLLVLLVDKKQKTSMIENEALGLLRKSKELFLSEYHSCKCDERTREYHTYLQDQIDIISKAMRGIEDNIFRCGYVPKTKLCEDDE